MKMQWYAAGLAVFAVMVSGGPVLQGQAVPAATAADSQATLDERIRKAGDELDIMELEVDYGLRLDNRDFDGYAANFAADGVLKSGLGEARGHDAIKEMLTKTLGPAEPAGETVSSIHLMTNPMIDINGDRASGTVKYVFVVTGEDGMPQPRIAAHYRDRYVRENGEWKIRERASHPDILPSNPLAGQTGAR